MATAADNKGDSADCAALSLAVGGTAINAPGPKSSNVPDPQTCDIYKLSCILLLYICEMLKKNTLQHEMTCFYLLLEAPDSSGTASPLHIYSFEPLSLLVAI